MPTITNSKTYDQMLDTRNLNCPLPILKTRRALKDMPTGHVLKLLTTDPGSVQDIASFCDATGHELMDQSCENDIFSFFIRKG